jgi:hypothetical protein
MSIFGDIMSKIFGGREAAAAQTASAANAAPAAGSTTAAGSAPAQSQTGAATAAAGQKVDVEAILADMAARNRQQLNWRTSIVDLMKLLNLDSSLQARQELARELHYTGDMNDSASMNIWLHKQVMLKLEQNGGKVPDELKS